MATAKPLLVAVATRAKDLVVALALWLYTTVPIIAVRFKALVVAVALWIWSGTPILMSCGRRARSSTAAGARRIWPSKQAFINGKNRTGRIIVAIASRMRPTRRVLMGAGFLAFIAVMIGIWSQIPPRFELEDLYASPRYPLQAAKFNESKVALLIENRPFPLLATFMLHFIAVVPQDWRFRFMGSKASVNKLYKSAAIQQQIALGKLDLTYIPPNMTTGSQEDISRFLTTLWLYEAVLQPAEWLLIFQTDSILCANSKKTLNSYLDYDWIGAPWNPNGQFGGNGGLSLRRVSTIMDILRHQKRAHWSEPEDVWLVERLGHRPGARLANGSESLTFSGEQHSGEKAPVSVDRRDPDDNSAQAKNPPDPEEGFYEPMGYHTGGSGRWLHAPIWGTPRLRKHIYDYCPEIKMTLAMDVAKFVPGECGATWEKRSLDGEFGVEPRAYSAADADEDMILDQRGYPRLPPGLVPW